MAGKGRENWLVQRIRQAARVAELELDQPAVVGFSGGRDSTVLLAALRPLFPDLRAVHVDHGLRPESAEDAKRAVAIAEKLGVRVDVRRIQGDVRFMHPGVGLEEALRRERFAALAKVTDEVVGELIILGHHAQDQAETVLLHLIRGAGLSGVTGMRERLLMQIPWWTATLETGLFHVWRPLLHTTPAELDRAMAELGIEPVIDPSNEDRDLRRNAIRHEVLPALERIHPGAMANISSFAELAGDDDDVLEIIAAELLQMAEWELSRDLLQVPQIALQRRLVRRWILGLIGDSELSSERVEAVRDALMANRGQKTIELAEGVNVRIRRGKAEIV